MRTLAPALDAFHEPVRRWFDAQFDAPTEAQVKSWPAIAAGRSTLLLAPTGSGKTLAAFLAAIDRLLFEPEAERVDGVRVLYVSPLKALSVDVERNLRAPLAGIAAAAAATGEATQAVRVGIRTGDTPQREREAMRRTPPEILVTTPESLYLLLTSRARETLRTVETVIVDEIHAMVGTKRGAHLLLSLERLEALRAEDARPLQRIGLSATLRPLDVVARALGGMTESDDGATTVPRPVDIVDAGAKKRFDLRIEVPVEDMADLGREVLPDGAAAGVARTSIWPAIHPMLVDHIRAHRSTILFVNSRRLAERLAGALNETAEEELALAHHGSIARKKRQEIEDRLKQGRVPAIVATSTLELGIDMGAVDQVIQIEAPPTVASGMQRIGRAGHHVGAVSRGVIVPKFRSDLLACAAASRRMRTGDVEALSVPANPLDVLAQHIVALVAIDDVEVETLYALARRAAPFAELPRSAFDGLLDMLSGRYPSDEFSDLRPRLTWDRTEGT
ncbi:MAG: DEAD/DEAH box helicase, partial [Planctomycetota bacterium]|nr:DEAD/DEAH box helicase [Planctomycetota bacterium]